MSANETPRVGGALENSAGGRVPSDSDTTRRRSRPATPVDVIERRRPAHELRDDEFALWRDGFRAGCTRMEARVAQAEADRDRYYYELNNSEEAKARHRAMLSDHAAAQVRRVMFAGTDAAHG